MRCEHYGWRIVSLHATKIRGQEAHNWMLLACAGCGTLWCLNFTFNDAPLP